MTNPTYKQAAAVYLDISHRLRDHENYPLVQLPYDLKDAMIQLGNCLNQISNLEAIAVSGEKLIQEQNVLIFNLEMENYNMTTQFDRLKEQPSDD